MSPNGISAVALFTAWSLVQPAAAGEFEWWESDRIESSHAVVGKARIFGSARIAQAEARAEANIALLQLRERVKQRLAESCELPRDATEKESSTSTTERKRLPGGGVAVTRTTSGDVGRAYAIETHESAGRLTVLVSAADPTRWTRKFLQSLLNHAEESEALKTSSQRSAAKKRVAKVLTEECRTIRRERLKLVGWEVSTCSGVGFSADMAADGRKASRKNAEARARRALEEATKGLIEEWEAHAKALGLGRKDRWAMTNAKSVVKVSQAVKFKTVSFERSDSGTYTLVAPSSTRWIEKVLDALEAESLAHKSASGSKKAFRKAMSSLKKQEVSEAKSAANDVKNVLKRLDE